MTHDQCVIGDRGCDICTRACPRLRSWESELDQELFGRPREREEVFGQYWSILLARTTGRRDRGGRPGRWARVHPAGVGTADRADRGGADVTDDAGRGPFDVEPFLATTRVDVLASAGSRYTYSANPLALAEADERRLKNLALVGMSCQASINGSLRLARSTSTRGRSH